MTAGVELVAQDAVRAVTARLAARLRDVPGVDVALEDGDVIVRGRGLSRRRVEEPALRRFGGVA